MQSPQSLVIVGVKSVAVTAASSAVLYGKAPAQLTQYSGPVASLSLKNTGTDTVFISVDYSETADSPQAAKSVPVASGDTYTLAPTPHGVYGVRVAVRCDGATGAVLSGHIATCPWCA